jgi:hypothetical protein
MNRYINADANGAVNIIRKVAEDTVLRHIDSVRSVVVTPFKINHFNKQKGIKLFNLIQN